MIKSFVHIGIGVIGAGEGEFMHTRTATTFSPESRIEFVVHDEGQVEKSTG